MKINGSIGIILIALTVVVVFSGFALAAKPVNQTPETQGISTSTSISAQGTVTESESISWTIVNNGPINSPPLGALQVVTPKPTQNPEQPPGGQAQITESAITDLTGIAEVQYSTGYNQNVMAVSGLTTYVKSSNVDTANKIADASNVKVATNVQFIAVDTGRMTFSEDILLDGAGEESETSSAMLCPFGPSSSEFIPDFCNIVQMGGSMDVTLVSAETAASDRFVAATADVPNVVTYSIAAKGMTVDSTNVPAMGTVSAFMKTHIMEARGDSDDKSEDLTYAETSTASGLINSFSKSMSFMDGMRRF
jgi:hypothetical protein